MPLILQQPKLELQPRISGAAKESHMKAYYLIVPVCMALLGGCTVVRPVAYTTPAATVSYVSPTYVAPPYMVVAP